VTPKSKHLSYLDLLEAESISVFREVAAQMRKPVLLFSGGKDSLVMLRLAEKAFRPAKFPFPILHVDTGHNFSEAIEFRDLTVARLGEKLIVRSVEDSIQAGRVVEEKGVGASRNSLQSVTLMDAIREYQFDAAIGGARRDEEKARAKERFFSLRDEFGQWDPKNQRPELWNLYNGRVHPGQHMRVFPLSNWTELDVWQYIERERLEIPSIYFAHEREMFRRKGILYPYAPFIELAKGEEVVRMKVRFRTVGDMTCTAAMESHATTLGEIIQEVVEAKQTERATRLDDQRSDSAMEDRKKQGYF
jgi:sulfate adenylyltransferase subunit 2